MDGSSKGRKCGTNRITNNRIVNIAGDKFPIGRQSVGMSRKRYCDKILTGLK